MLVARVRLLTEFSRTSDQSLQCSLAVFATRETIVANMVMQFRLIAIPAPAAVFLDHNILERIERKFAIRHGGLALYWPCYRAKDEEYPRPGMRCRTGPFRGTARPRQEIASAAARSQMATV